MTKGLISVIVPNRVGEKNESLPSIKKQTYKKIQIIEIVDKFKKGASWTRNQGLKKAKGEFIFWCDNDVELEKDCLANLYDTLKKHPEADWAFGRFYIDGSELNKDKQFPPPEDKDSKEYIDYFHGVSTMSLIRASAKPRFDEEVLRFDDWDLWIRMGRAGHEPVFCDKILFKTYNRPTGLSVVKGRLDEQAKLYARFLNKKKADIIIPHHDKHDMLANCLAGIDNNIFNIIIVSGGTFGENCNKGARLAETNKLIFLNDDVEADNEILKELADTPEDICGISQMMGDRKILGIGLYKRRINLATDFFFATRKWEVVIPSGYCFKIKKTVWEKLGGFDERFKNGAEDFDLFLKALESKMKIGYLDRPMMHHHSQSSGRFAYEKENWEIFNKIWEKRIKKININQSEKINEVEEVVDSGDWITI